MARGSEDYQKNVISALSDIALDSLTGIRDKIVLTQIASDSGTTDFTDTTNNKAYREYWPEKPPTTAPRETGTEFTTTEYESILTANNSGVIRTWSTAGYHAFIFRFKKPTAALAAGQIIITVRGKMQSPFCSAKARVYVYNDNSSAWEEFGEHIDKDDGWKTVTKTISVGTNYLNGSSYLYVLMIGEEFLDASYGCLVKAIWIDYISVDWATGYVQGVQIDDTITETDDNDIAKDQETLVVINLNYVWDAANTKWVRMTQP